MIKQKKSRKIAGLFNIYLENSYPFKASHF